MTQAPPDTSRPETRTPRGWGALVLSVLVLAAAVVGVIARGPQTADALVYAYSFEKGEKRSYDFNMRMTFSPEGIHGVPAAFEMPPGTISGTMTFEAIDTRPDGSTLVEIRMQDMQVSFSGLPSDGVTVDEPVRMLIGPRGEIRDIEGSGLFGGMDPSRFLGLGSATGTSALGSGSLFPTFPDKAIAPGDTWTESLTIPSPFGKGTIKVTTDGKHLGFENTSFGRAARMQTTSVVPLNIDFSFADLFSSLGQAVPGQTQMPEGSDLGRMVIKGSMNGDTQSLVPPNGGDFVKMIADMDMDFDMSMSSPVVPSAGEAQSFGMKMSVHMELTRAT